VSVDTELYPADLAILRTTPARPGIVLADHHLGRWSGT